MTGVNGRTAARLTAVSALVLAALAVLLAVRASLPEAGGEEPAASVQTCRALDLDGPLDETVVCRTPSATLTIAEVGQPLVLGETEARVTKATVDGATVTVRLRLRNKTSSGQRFDAEERQVYLNLAGRRVMPLPESRDIPAGEAVTIPLRWQLDDTAAEALAAADGRTELGIVPFDEVGRRRPGHVGVVRLKLS